MSKNGQTHFKNLAAFLTCVWPLWDIMHSRVKFRNLAEIYLVLPNLISSDEDQEWLLEAWKLTSKYI